MENGLLFLTPLSTLRAILDSPDTVNAYWVRTTSPDHGLIDRTTTQLEDRLAAAGYSVGTNISYVDQARNVDANRQISTAIGILGFLIVAISMVGLVNAITMNVLERTREIGVLRCIGARARDIRRIFAAEGLTVSLAGWLLGIPVGYALARLLNWLLLEVVGIEFAFTFPPLNVLIALVGTVVLALLIMRIPLRRAVRLQAGRGPPLCMSPRSTCPRVGSRPRLPLARRVSRPASTCSCSPGAAAIVALHALVDSFVAPEPGTGPDDHLLRGLGVARLLALAAVAYPRLSARADVRRSPPSLGVARARRRGARDRGRACGRRPRRGLDRLPAPPVRPAAARAGRGAPMALAQARPVSLPPPSGIVVASRTCGYWLVVPVAIGILATHRPRAAVEPADLGRPYEEVTLRTSDGLDLAAWYVPSRNGAAVISYPTRQGKLPQARMLVRHGYGVLLLDARGYDGSEGDPNLLRLGERQGHRRRCRLVAETARREGRAHRRHRLLGRRRDDAPGRGVQHRASRGRFGGRGRALGPRAPAPRAARAGSRCRQPPCKRLQ